MNSQLNTIHEDTLGQAWVSLVRAVLKNGQIAFDEKRKRQALFDVRVRSETQDIPDAIIENYGDKKNLKRVLAMTFSENTMVDIDVIPSFKTGAKSYSQRIQEGKMLLFVVERLSAIPESKKAVMVFPTYEDYKQVLANPKDDYLPCIVAIQFRLLHQNRGWRLVTNFYARSLDVCQKGHGNLWAMAALSEKVAREVSKNIKQPITVGHLDGFIADAHIYGETLVDARKTVQNYETAIRR